MAGLTAHVQDHLHRPAQWRGSSAIAAFQGVPSDQLGALRSEG